MVNKMNDQTVSILMRGQIPEPDPERVREAPAQNRQQRRQYTENRTDMNPFWMAVPVCRCSLTPR